MAMNPFVNATKQLENAASLLNLDKNVLEILKNPKRILEVSIPIKMDSGDIEVFRGYRVQYNDALGPFKAESDSILRSIFQKSKRFLRG